MYVKPCRNCPHKSGCAIKERTLRKLRSVSLRLSSINFKCEVRLSTLPPGQRVRMSINFCDSDDEYCGEDEVERTGTVMRPYRNRLLVWLDETTALDRNPVALRPDRIEPIQGIPLVKLCPTCDQPDGTTPAPRKDGKGMWFCEDCQ